MVGSIPTSRTSIKTIKTIKSIKTYKRRCYDEEYYDQG